jgi:hypothetical protein
MLYLNVLIKINLMQYKYLAKSQRIYNEETSQLRIKANKPYSLELFFNYSKIGPESSTFKSFCNNFLKYSHNVSKVKASFFQRFIN